MPFFRVLDKVSTGSKKSPKPRFFIFLDLIFTPVSLSIMIRDLESAAGGGLMVPIPVSPTPVLTYFLDRGGDCISGNLINHLIIY